MDPILNTVDCNIDCRNTSVVTTSATTAAMATLEMMMDYALVIIKDSRAMSFLCWEISEVSLSFRRQAHFPIRLNKFHCIEINTPREEASTSNESYPRRWKSTIPKTQLSVVRLRNGKSKLQK
jgi:hypothetical protein